MLIINSTSNNNFPVMSFAARVCSLSLLRALMQVSNITLRRGSADSAEQAFRRELTVSGTLLPEEMAEAIVALT